MHISTLRVRKAGPIVCTLFILFLLCASPFNRLNAQNLDFKSSSLVLPSNQLERIFGSKKGDQVDLAFVNDRKETVRCQASVLSHINTGSTTGVLRLTIKSTAGEASFLLSRKLVNGRLVYLLNLMLPGKTDAYRLQSESKDGFVLVKTSKDKIVTE
jgi:hypothetical protein